MSKTAMEEYMDWLNTYSENNKALPNLHIMRLKSIEIYEKEKQQIIEAVDEGRIAWSNGDFKEEDGEQYFKNKYNK